MIVFLILLFYFGKKKLSQPLTTIKEKPVTKIKIIPELYKKSEKTCSNSYADCAKWAKAGECEINPEYMLFACPGACKACDLSPEQKQEIIIKASKLPLPGCAYHGEAYPGYIMPDYKNL